MKRYRRWNWGEGAGSGGPRPASGRSGAGVEVAPVPAGDVGRRGERRGEGGKKGEERKRKEKEREARCARYDAMASSPPPDRVERCRPKGLKALSETIHVHPRPPRIAQRLIADYNSLGLSPIYLKWSVSLSTNRPTPACPPASRVPLLSPPRYEFRLGFKGAETRQHLTRNSSPL
jgi:hypothetical protein